MVIIDYLQAKQIIESGWKINERIHISCSYQTYDKVSPVGHMKYGLGVV